MKFGERYLIKCVLSGSEAHYLINRLETKSSRANQIIDSLNNVFGAVEINKLGEWEYQQLKESLKVLT